MTTRASLAHSTYEGWVAWVEDTPIFEHIPFNPKLLSTVKNASDRPIRPEDKNTKDWKDIPHEKVTSLEVYAFRERYNQGGPWGTGQPIVRIDLKPEMTGHARWIQFKETGIVTGVGYHPDKRAADSSYDWTDLHKPERLGVIAYHVGYWNTKLGVGDIITIKKDGYRNRETLTTHPCYPKHLGGKGLAPEVLGLEPEDIKQFETS